MKLYSKDSVKFEQIYIILHITYVEIDSRACLYLKKFSLSLSLSRTRAHTHADTHVQNLGMDNASFTFGVDFQAIWSIASHFAVRTLYTNVSISWRVKSTYFQFQSHAFGRSCSPSNGALWRMNGIISAYYFPYRCCRGNSESKLFFDATVET